MKEKRDNFKGKRKKEKWKKWKFLYNFKGM